MGKREKEKGNDGDEEGKRDPKGDKETTYGIPYFMMKS